MASLEPESPGLGDLVPYVLVVISLIAVALIHLPWAPYSLQASSHALTNLVGMEVRWTMFSADPRGTAVDLYAVIEREDGSVVRWEVTRSLPGGELREYRWVKWAEKAVLDTPTDQVAGLVAWLRQQPGASVERVTVYGLRRKPGEVRGPRPDPKALVLYEWNREES